MTDSLQDILGNKSFEPPDEFKMVREYIQRRYKSNSYVKMQRDAIIVTVRGSALAATIQMDRQRLIDECGITKRLVIRNGR